MNRFYNSRLATRLKPFFLAGTIVLFSISFIYITYKVLFPINDGQGQDFRFLWLAGRLWLQGKNPYDNSVFMDESTKIWGEAIINWAYPPSWAPISMFFGIFSFEISELFWRILNYSSLIGIIIITVLWLQSYGFSHWRDKRVWIGASYGFLLQSTPIVVALGQTSIICTLGLMILLYSSRKKKFIPAIIGGYLLALKPQLGIVILTALFIAGNYQIIIGSIGLAVLGSGLACFRSGFSENIQGFFTNLSKYSQIKLNQPPDLTGLTQLLNYYASLEVSSKIFALFGVVLGIGCGFLIRRYSFKGEIERAINPKLLNSVYLQSIMITIIGTIFLMPMHIYDFVVIIPLVIFSMYLPLRHSIWFMPAWIILLRVVNLSRLTGIYNPEATPYSLGALLGTFAALILLISSVGVFLNSINRLKLLKLNYIK